MPTDILGDGSNLVGDVTTCVDVNECEVDGGHNCNADIGESCYNEVPGYYCACAPGMEPDDVTGQSSADDSSKFELQTVRTKLQLTSNERYWCQLNSGKGECVDIDECMDVDFICDPNAMCVNDIMDVAKVNFLGIWGLIY